MYLMLHSILFGTQGENKDKQRKCSGTVIRVVIQFLKLEQGQPRLHHHNLT